MIHRRLNSGTKSVIWITGIVLSVAVEYKFFSDRNQAESNFKRECHQELHKSVVDVAAQFQALYADLRTIARMPSVRTNRITKKFLADDWADIRELYASMAESTPVRMVRLVPYYNQWSAGTVDTLTLSKNFGTGKGDEKLPIHSASLHLLKTQMEKMPYDNGGWRWDSLQDYPAYSCRPFLVKIGKGKKAVKDYLFYYSVPIYSENGVIWGAASAELPFTTITRLLPSGDYNLVNDHDGVNVHSAVDARNHDSIIYKEETPISIHDRMGKWKLQYNVPSSTFNSRPDVVAAQGFRWAAHFIVAAITVAAFFVFSSLSRRRYELEEAKESLEIRVSERTNELAEALRHAKDASRTKGEFLANMSHEIRTPMNGVMAMTEMLLRTRMDEEQEDLARTISASAESLLTIINDVLDFSKIEARKLILEQIEFNLADLLEDVVKLYSPAAAAKGLELVADLDPNTEKTIVSDPVRIRQIASNLLGNAMKFTDHGAVILKAKINEDDPSRLRFSVKDTGVGIPASRIDAIFESFTQSDASTTRKFGGTGLGLTICRHLAELMGGNIGVQSKLGKGSEFYVNVRVHEADITNREAALDTAARKRVLVCDDFPTALEVMSRQLVSAGHDVVSCHSGEELLNWLQRTDKPFDVIVVDQSLDGKDGVAFATQIKKQGLAKGSTVILTTLSPTGLPPEDLSKGGVTQTLMKPIRRQALYRAVQAELIVEELIPIVKEAPSPVEPPGPPGAAPESWLNLLLVEDNPVNQKVAKKLLSSMGCTVTVANDGAEAIEMDLSLFDVVFMDCQMPRLDGLSATRQIRHREQRTGDHAIIVALTANAMAEDRIACLDAGMDEYMAKPLRQKVLEEMLLKLTGKRYAA